MIYTTIIDKWLNIRLYYGLPRLDRYNPLTRCKCWILKNKIFWYDDMFGFVITTNIDNLERGYAVDLDPIDCADNLEAAISISINNCKDTLLLLGYTQVDVKVEGFIVMSVIL